MINTDYRYELTIGIVSYNRPIELARAINSLLPIPENVEVLICDDKSPKIFEIEKAIQPFLSISNIKFIKNKNNLGYDRNLFNVIECSNSSYVLLLGDDDYFELGTIGKVLHFIEKNDDFHCAFLKFRDNVQKKVYRNFHSDQYFNPNTLSKDGSFLYNSILFSGLLFSKKDVVENKLIFEKYFKSIYIQVSIFIFLSSKFGSYFIDAPGVVIGGDGESGFGFNEASVDNDFELKDRSSIISNLAYHKRLFEVINKIEFDIGTNIYKAFVKEYKIRCVKSIFIARSHGRSYLNTYWKKLTELKIKTKWHLFPVYLLAYIIPFKILNFLISFFERIIKGRFAFLPKQ